VAAVPCCFAGVNNVAVRYCLQLLAMSLTAGLRTEAEATPRTSLFHGLLPASGPVASAGLPYMLLVNFAVAGIFVAASVSSC